MRWPEPHGNNRVIRKEEPLASRRCRSIAPALATKKHLVTWLVMVFIGTIAIAGRPGRDATASTAKQCIHQCKGATGACVGDARARFQEERAACRTRSCRDA